MGSYTHCHWEIGFRCPRRSDRTIVTEAMFGRGLSGAIQFQEISVQGDLKKTWFEEIGFDWLLSIKSE